MLQVVDLANTAYENTTAPEIKAESCFLKARVHHARGNLSEAKLLYTEACNLWPQFPPAQYGMAQMLVYEGNIDLAVKALDAVLAELPDNQVQKGCGCKLFWYAVKCPLGINICAPTESRYHGFRT